MIAPARCTAPMAEACTACGGTDHDGAAHLRVSAAISMAQRELADGQITRGRLWLAVAEKLAREMEQSE